MKPQSDDGIYPIRPGQTVELGDFGYMDGNGRWCRLDNIENIPGFDVYLHKTAPDIEQDIVINHGVTVNLMAGAEIGLKEGGAACTLTFNLDNNFYIKGIVKVASRYESLAFEIKDFLESLRKKDIWKSNYRLVSEVLVSPKYIAIYSNQKGASVTFHADLHNATPTKEIKLGAELLMEANQTGLEIVNKTKDSDPSPIGFKLVKLEKDSILSRRRSLVYDSDGNITGDILDDDPECEWISD